LWAFHHDDSLDRAMKRRHEGDHYDCQQQGLDRRQILADRVQRAVDREQALADRSQADLQERWVQAALAQAASGPGDLTAQTVLRWIALALAEDQRHHDARQALIDLAQAATDTFQRCVDAQQAGLDEAIIAATHAQVAYPHGKRRRASVGRRRSRRRNAGALANECI